MEAFRTRNVLQVLHIPLLASAIVLALCSSAAVRGQYYDVNVDLTNLGDPAHDYKVVLVGSENVQDTFDGYDLTFPAHYPIGWFNPPSIGPEGGNTAIHWQGFQDLDNGIIDTGQTIHLGWKTENGSSNVFEQFWTDLNGDPICGT